jgi:hypothetical protein
MFALPPKADIGRCGWVRISKAYSVDERDVPRCTTNGRMTPRRIPVDHPKLEKMAGDALEIATVKRAPTGVDAVAQSLGVSAGPEIIFEPTRLFSKATQVLVTAMQLNELISQAQ